MNISVNITDMTPYVTSGKLTGNGVYSIERDIQPPLAAAFALMAVDPSVTTVTMPVHHLHATVGSAVITQ